MGFDLSSVVAMASDYARNYMFYAQVSKSPAMIEMNPQHKYLVSTTQLPKQTIEEITTDWQGMVYKVGGTSTFETLDIEFKCDTAQLLRSQFLLWMRQVHDPLTNIHGVPHLYFGTLGLSQLSTQGVPIMSYDIHNCWPSNVGEVTLDYSSKEISKFTVTFTYLWHTYSSIGLPGEAVGSIA